MNKLEIACFRAAAEGIRKKTSFSGIIPGEPMGFEEGDVFTMPTQFNVFEEKIGETYNQFIFVETQNGDVRKLYPSQLSRRVRAYDMDGTPLTVVTANGTASQLYKMYGTIDDGMNALKGKTIRVSKATLVGTMMFGEYTHKTVYTFDLV